MKKLSFFLISLLFFVLSSYADVTFRVNHLQDQGNGQTKLVKTDEYIFTEEADRKGREGLQKLRVTGVTEDGCLILSNRERVKLLGVDYVNYFAIAQYLSSLKNQEAWFAYEPQLIDSQGHILAYVFTADKIFLNAEVIRRGWAYADNSHPCRFYDVFKSYEVHSPRGR